MPTMRSWERPIRSTSGRIAHGVYTVRRFGTLVVPADNTVSKAIVLNCRDDNSFSVAAAHTLSIIRGALGAMGVPGTPGGGGGGTGDDAYDWATEGDTSNVPDDKLPDTLLTGIDSLHLSRRHPRHRLELRPDRRESTNNGQITLPDFLDATEVWDWALASNADRLPNSKHGLDVVTSITSVTYDTGTRNPRVRLPQADGGETFQEAVLPEWLTSADVQNWAETGDNSNVPTSKLPGTLVTASDAFTYDVPSHTIQLQLTRLSGGSGCGHGHASLSFLMRPRSRPGR